MGKNYIESSLKRFLKRKVKITLGVVVTFLITGMVSFAEGTAEKEIKQESNKNHWEWNQVKNAEEYIKTGDSLISVTDTAGNQDKYFIFKDDKYQVKIDGKNLTFSIKDKLSNKTTANINNTFTLLDNTLNKNQFEKIEELGDKYNKALDLKHTAQSIYKAGKGETAIVDTDVKEEAIVQTADNGIIINKGILLKEQNGKNNSEIYNFGLISSSKQIIKDSVAYNYGIINDGGQSGTGVLSNYGLIYTGNNGIGQSVTGEAYNYGIISVYFTATGQRAAEKGKIYNYGLITGKGAVQTTGANNAEIYNYGNIEHTPSYTIDHNILGTGQNIYNGTGNTVYNYGIINSYRAANGMIAAQGIRTSGNKIYNFGEINIKKSDKDAGVIAQYVDTKENENSNSVLYNYGDINIINTTNNTGKEIGQYVKGYKSADNSIITNNKAYNYGTINAGSGVGQYLEKSGEIYNFGTIKNENGTGYAMEIKDGSEGNYKAENYGIADVKNGKAFSGDIVNRGFVITQDGTYTDNAWTGENKNLGVILDENLTLAQGSTEANGINKNVIDLSGKTNIVLKDDSISVEDKPLENTDGKTTVFMKNQNAQLTGEKYNNKNILAVVDDNWDSSKGAIIQADNDKSLDLTNTVVTGYFAGTKGGTVLSTNSDLTLVGDTVISAIKGEKVTEDVYALSIKNGTMLTFLGNAQINGKINGKEGGISNVASHKFETTGGEIGKLQFRNANKEMLNAAGIKAEENYTDVTIGSGTEELVIDSLELSFRGTAKDKVNKIVLGENVKVTGNIDGTNSKYHKDDENITGLGADNKIDLTVNNISNITGNITLGECDDIITINNNGEYTKVIEGNLGTDTLNVNGNTKKAVSENIFDYKVNSIENINLNGDWRIGKNAEVTFKNNGGSSKAVNTNSVNLNVSGKLTAEMNNNKGNGDFTTSLDKITSGNDMTVTAKGGIKYEMGEDFAINSSSFTTNSKFTLGQYEVEKDETTKDIVKEDTKLSASGIFEISQNKDNSVTLRVKSADELGIGSYAPVYEAILAGVGSKQELTDKLNSIETSEGVANLVKGTTEAAKAYYTAGNVVTKNIVDTYLSSVTEFKDKADKGEWIAYGKYINSDTEFDGGSEVKGYDGDIKGTVGMIEYGMTDSTSYGAVFGKGDTKVDINDGGELSGDNYYGGLYFKHRTAEGIDVLGSFGIVKSDLDSKLKNSFEVPEIGTADALVDGTADSKAVSAVLKAKKDYYVAEGLKVQPVVGAALTLITQEEAENKKMGLTISQQDVDVYELITGVNVIKEFALESGKLEVGAGVEYSWANSNQDRDAKYMLNGRELTLEDSEIASSKGKAQFGAEYIHENGVGIDAKYEMMWSDSGDDSRITAGISYRF